MTNTRDWEINPRTYSLGCQFRKISAAVQCELYVTLKILIFLHNEPWSYAQCSILAYGNIILLYLMQLYFCSLKQQNSKFSKRSEHTDFGCTLIGPRDLFSSNIWARNIRNWF